jgi:hypothetical protein
MKNPLRTGGIGTAGVPPYLRFWLEGAEEA